VFYVLTVSSILQNWMSFGKIAHDLVMRMQKIDGDNYPEVGERDLFFVLVSC